MKQKIINTLEVHELVGIELDKMRSELEDTHDTSIIKEIEKREIENNAQIAILRFLLND